MNQAWDIGWRVAVTELEAVVVFSAFMVLGKVAGVTLDASYLTICLVGGGIFALGIWVLGWIWHPYLPKPRQPGEMEPS
jgi:hypothetical protein